MAKLKCPVCDNPLGEFREGERKRCVGCDNTLKEDQGSLRVLTYKEIFGLEKPA